MATTWFYFDPLSFTMIPLAFCRGQTGELKGDTSSSFKSLMMMLVSAVPLVIKHRSFKDLPLPLSNIVAFIPLAKEPILIALR